MGDGFKRRIEYDLMYDTCIYSGILLSSKLEAPVPCSLFYPKLAV